MPLKPRSAILLTCPVISPESKSIVPKPTRESSFFIAPASQLMQSPVMLYSLYCDGNGAKQTALYRTLVHELFERIYPAARSRFLRENMGVVCKNMIILHLFSFDLGRSRRGGIRRRHGSVYSEDYAERYQLIFRVEDIELVAVAPGEPLLVDVHNIPVAVIE